MKISQDRISVRLPARLMKLIHADAKATRRQLSDYIRLALQDHVTAAALSKKSKES